MTVRALPKYCWQWLRTPSPGVLYDRQLVWTSLLLMVIGLVMVTSASIPVGLRLADAPFFVCQTPCLLFAGCHAGGGGSDVYPCQTLATLQRLYAIGLIDSLTSGLGGGSLGQWCRAVDFYRGDQYPTGRDCQVIFVCLF